ncbi:MAG: hypothetical protein L7H12_04140 [Sulfolobales archaeon]|nr:hypothetical protein [Sulfolobales archaeon]MCG2883293.1 hypothetical protein [Sulfolobales archaeon]MCG2908108.1 hypothetical protein [Sulfolobales archaeon]
MLIKRGSLLSFFSSGFPAHVRLRAIDLSSPDMMMFYSPVSGEVVSVEEFTVGRPNRHASAPNDYVILLRINGSTVKVLHVKPWVRPGELIEEGKPMGEFVSSPYTAGDFPHAHLEGLSFRFRSVTNYVESKVGRVVEVGRDYFDVEVLDYASIGRLRGLGCCGGLLNVTFPYACYGGIIGGWDGTLEAFGIELGVRAIRVRRNVVLFEGKKGLLRNWESEASFKVLRNEPVCGGRAIFEAVLSYGGRPRVRFFSEYSGRVGDRVELTRLVRHYLARQVP